MRGLIAQAGAQANAPTSGRGRAYPFVRDIEGGDALTGEPCFGDNRIAAGRGFACAIGEVSVRSSLTPPQANPDVRHAPLPLRDPRRLSECRPQGGRLVEGFR